MTERIQLSKLTTAALFITGGLCLTLIFFMFLQSSEVNNKLEANLSEAKSSQAQPQVMLTGGLGAVRQKDDEVDSAVQKVKPLLEEETKTKYDLIDVIHYKTQVVAGKNYFVKAKAKTIDGVEDIIHLRIYRDLDNKYSLTAHETNKKVEDELKYFQ